MQNLVCDTREIPQTEHRNVWTLEREEGDGQELQNEGLKTCRTALSSNGRKISGQGI